MKKTRKPYDQMNAAELAEATKEYDREAPGIPGKPLTAAQRAQHARAKKMGRPKKGQGSAVLAVSVEKGLLKDADALAKRRKQGRSAFVAALIQAELDREGPPVGRMLNITEGERPAARQPATGKAEPTRRTIDRAKQRPSRTA